MPDWCSNRLCIHGHPEHIAEIRPLLEGTLSPGYPRAEREGIQLFLAGCAGLLTPTEAVTYAPFPSLSAISGGIVSPENLAYTRWLRMLKNGAELDIPNCQTLHQLWLDSGLPSRRWQTLSVAAQEIIRTLYDRKGFDWCEVWRKPDVNVWWDSLCDNATVDPRRPLDMCLVLPTRLDVEINGFNGGLLDGVPSAYGWYIDRYGVKWPNGQDLNISCAGKDFVQVDFDTPWSPVGDDVLSALSLMFRCQIEHWYAEQGCDFCGYARYERGEQEDAICSSLEWGVVDEDDGEGFLEVTGPEWIMCNVASFGG
jgi:hypothetical protein